MEIPHDAASTSIETSAIWGVRDSPLMAKIYWKFIALGQFLAPQRTHMTPPNSHRRFQPFQPAWRVQASPCESWLRITILKKYVEIDRLVGGPGPPLWKRLDFVNWDDDIPTQYFWENKIDGNQTTNQIPYQTTNQQNIPFRSFQKWSRPHDPQQPAAFVIRDVDVSILRLPRLSMNMWGS